MKAIVFGIVILWVSVLSAGCAGPPAGLFPPRPGEASKTIYLVSHGWHAGIVLERADLAVAAWPPRPEFADAEFLEVGWGDRDYYMNPAPHLGITLKAALVPTASVLHLVGFRGPVRRYFPRSEVIRIELSEAGFDRLGRYLGRSFAVDETGASRPLGPALYGRGGFYLSRERYHLFNTCNVWTARALREAGCPIVPAAKLTVGSLMSAAANCGSVIRDR